MKFLLTRSTAILFAIGAGSVAMAQNFPPDWGVECTDPQNQQPASIPYIANQVNNELFSCVLGGSGTYTFGGGTGPCYGAPIGAKSAPNAGKFCFSYGDWTGGTDGVTGVGSIQQYSNNFHSANLALNFGAPSLPSYAYANLIVDGKKEYFGASFREFFRGFSNRYMFFTQTIGDLDINLHVELVCDAVRMRWLITDTAPTSHNIGLWFGSGVNMLTDELNFPGNASENGANGSGVTPFFNASTNSGRNFKPTYIYLPNQRPPDTDIAFDRATNASTFPAYVDFLFGQTDAFGMRFENEPSEATNDTSTNQPTKANGFTLGKSLFVIGDITDGTPTFPEFLEPDTGFLGSVGFIQKFQTQQVLPGQQLQILNYVRSNWGNGSYSLPYGAVVDAPHLISTRDTNFDGSPNPTGITPNPFTLRTWVDNVGGFAFDQKEFPLNDVRIQLSFDNPGVTIVGGSALRTIPDVEPRQDAFVDYQCKIGPDVVGLVGYKVIIDSQPGTVHKEINGTIVVAARPRTTLYPGPNMISAPYKFADSSWNAILGNFVDPAVPNASVQTYTWDPRQKGYVISLDSERGRGAWAIYHNPANKPQTQNFTGNPQTPPGFNDQTQLVQLASGWNMIGDPYNYSFPINQINGVSSGDPQHAHTFGELVSLGFVSNFVAYWDAAQQAYVYVNSGDGELDPLKGYWINVLTDNDLTLSYPPLFVEGLPGSNRKRKVAPAKMSPTNWKFQVVAQMNNSVDSQNYVGLAPNIVEVRKGRVYEPPMAPNQMVSFATVESINNKAQRLATALNVPKPGYYRWDMSLYTTKAGSVTIRFPNVGVLPTSLQFKFVDETANKIIDPRAVRSYTFAATMGDRRFALVAQPK
jgi:hypothetical protein